MGLERFIYFFLTGMDGKKTAYKVGRYARDIMDVTPVEHDRMEIPRGSRAGHGEIEEEE